MNIDLHTLSLKELKGLQSSVAKAIAGFEDRKKSEARAELEARARELGFSLSDLATANSASNKRTSAAPKYANPANPADTWTGRGRKPRWFSEALAGGRNPEDLAI